MGVNDKLTYEQWRQYFSPVTNDVRTTLKELHNVDADKEIEEAIRKEYEFYINNEYSKGTK